MGGATSVRCCRTRAARRCRVKKERPTPRCKVHKTHAWSQRRIHGLLRAPRPLWRPSARQLDHLRVQVGNRRFPLCDREKNQRRPWSIRVVGIGTSDFFCATAQCQPFAPETEVACRNPKNLAMDLVFWSKKKAEMASLVPLGRRPVDERHRQT